MPGDIATIFADRGEDFTCYPTLKFFRIWQLTRKHQGIKPGFVNDNSVLILIPVKKHNFAPVIFVYMAVNISTTVLVPEDASYILSNEVNLILSLYCPNSFQYCPGLTNRFPPTLAPLTHTHLR